eukprot:scaffold2663_cov256-Pinguiococcus_pyrenoidosus.AAC.19
MGSKQLSRRLYLSIHEQPRGVGMRVVRQARKGLHAKASSHDHQKLDPLVKVPRSELPESLRQALPKEDDVGLHEAHMARSAHHRHLGGPPCKRIHQLF